MSLASQGRRSNSIERARKDHFADLAIPDYRLHLLSPETVDTTDSQSTISDDSPLMTPNHSFLGIIGGNRIALSSTTNLVHLQEANRSSKDLSTTITVTSSQPKLKGIMKHPSGGGSLVPSLSVTAQPEIIERQQASPLSFDVIQDHAVESFSRHATKIQHELPQMHSHIDLQEKTSFERADSTLHRTDSHIKPVRRESVSIPITTTTGYAPGQQSLPSSPRSRREIGSHQNNGSFATPTSSCQQEHIAKTSPVLKSDRTSSPPITPRRGSLNLVLGPETPEIGTISSTHHVELEKKPPTRVSTPTTPRLSRILQLNAEKREAEEQKEQKENATIEKAEPIRIHVPKLVESKGILRQNSRSQRLDQEQHSTSPIPIPAVTMQDYHPRSRPEERRGSIVEENAKKPALRSKSREKVRSKSIDRKASRTPSPGKSKPAGSNRMTAESKHSLPLKRVKKKRANEDGGGIGVPSKPEHVSRNTNLTQYNKGNPVEYAEKPIAGISAVHICKMVYIVFLGLACTWWMMVQPAFDQQSELWKRRHRKESTWNDVGIFASAGMSCLAGALGGWLALRMVCWIF